MSNKILVTGAIGNVGGEVVRLLHEKWAAGVNTGTIEGVDTVVIDYGDTVSLEEAMQGISTLFMVLPNHPDMTKWGENIVDVAKKSDVKHIVRSGGSLADLDPPIQIRRIIAEIDQYLKNSGIDYTITVPSFFCK